MPLYGDPQFHLDNDDTDLIGLRTVTYGKIWQPSRWPMSMAELDAEKPDPPEVSGGVVLINSRTLPRGGGLRTTWTFRGINGDGKSVTFKTRANSIDYGFEPGFSEVNLLRLPDIQTLMDENGGYPVDGQIVWQPTIPKSASSGSGVVKTGNDEGKPNPLFGYQSYFVISGTYHFRYCVRSKSEIPDVAGKIFESAKLPGDAPVMEGRNWLALAPAPHRVGPVYDVLESYWLSGDGGWPTQIYGKKKNNGSGSTALTTGSLTTGSL